jgi:hypothetical protein
LASSGHSALSTMPNIASHAVNRRFTMGHFLNSAADYNKFRSA